MITIENKEGLEYLETIEDNTVDLILTDPPYITSRESGMNKWVEHVKKQDSPESLDARDEDSWNIWVKANTAKLENRTQKQVSLMKKNFVKYGSVYGKKYARKTDFGDWDKNFTLQKLELFVSHFYRTLKKGGTAIIFFDWKKSSFLIEMLEKKGFKQIRKIDWNKTNPQPLNSSRNYLTNAQEVALTAVKGGKPTFNSEYDTGIYEFPTQAGKNRIHPTQKSLLLFKELVKKHSNPGDLVLDPFLGAGTTAIAAKELKRDFIGCEIDETFYKKSIEWVEELS
ncbi:DNA modification methylase [Candidatus Woesebacteria bacterium]|nr:DNA modification methylase [Candidatus Woesebacteria bacterium]